MTRRKPRRLRRAFNRACRTFPLYRLTGPDEWTRIQGSHQRLNVALLERRYQLFVAALSTATFSGTDSYHPPPRASRARFTIITTIYTPMHSERTHDDG